MEAPPPYDIQGSVNADREEFFKVYKRRWYVLLVYSIYSCTQSAVWNTWGPISTTSIDAFGWQTSTIAWLNNWGPASYILTGLLFPWLLQVKGLRWVTVSSMFFVAAGTAFRVVTSEPSTATILIHVGQFLNGVGGPASSGAIPAVSATWFPPAERVTATALSNSINTFGTAVAFILGPALVTGVPSNKTSPPHTYLLFDSDYTESVIPELNNVTAVRRKIERDEIMKYMYYTCGWSVFLFVIIVCYFPSKPPLPPSVSATMERHNYWKGLCSLRSNGYFIIITLVFGVSTGVYGGWTSVLTMNLSMASISEGTAGWMGFYSTIAGCIASLIVGRFADRFLHHIRLFVLIMYVLCAAALTIFTLMLINILQRSLIGFYATTIVASTTINVAIPLIYELGCELTYPTSEGTANGVLTFFGNIFGLIFLALFSIPGIGTMWMNWTVIGSTAACIPLLAVLKGRFNRLEVDEGIHAERYAENVITVPEEYNAEAPLLPDRGGHSKVSSRRDSVASGNYVNQNPLPTDEVVPSDATVPSNAAMHLDDALLSPADLNIPEHYGSQDSLLIN